MPNDLLARLFYRKTNSDDPREVQKARAALLCYLRRASTETLSEIAKRLSLETASVESIMEDFEARGKEPGYVRWILPRRS